MTTSRSDQRRSRTRPVIRPPWATTDDPAAFDQACRGCTLCGDSCPEEIIHPDRAGRPVVDFSHGACTFCGDCVEVCRTGVLKREPGSAPWGLKAAIGADCLPFARKGCRACAEHCSAGAIRFPPADADDPAPTVDHALCTGCGACVAPCPAGAVTVAAA